MATLTIVDARLRWLQDAVSAISESLLALELDERRARLAALPLEGATAELWERENTVVLKLWGALTALEALLADAVRLRGTRGRLPAGTLAGLADLLQGASLEPFVAARASRKLLGGPSRCTPDELIVQMTAAFDAVKHTAQTIAEAQDAWRERMIAARRACMRLAGSDAIRARVETLAGAGQCDPLAVTEAEVADLETELRAALEAQRSAQAQRARLRGRLSAAPELLRAIELTSADCIRAGRHARARIVGAAVAEPPRLDADLHGELERVATLVRDGEWLAAQTALDAWATRAGALLDRARSALAVNRAPVRERDELRGRLDAYAAKAGSLGLGGGELLALARGALYTPPTDLRRASELVERYGRSLIVRPVTA